MNNKQVIEEQPECSSSREVYDPEVPMGPESVIPKMATDVVGDVEVEYERFQLEEAQLEGASSSRRPVVPAPTEIPLPKWYTSLMKDAEGKLPVAQGKRKSKMRPEQVNFSLMAKVLTKDKPSTFEKARKEKKWNAAMDVEIQAVQKNKTWDLVKLPAGKKVIGCRWVYKTKYRADGSIDKHNARLVGKGYKQQEGINYRETFAPVAKMNIVRIILALVAQLNWQLYQMDVKSAFLNGDLSEEVYMEQPHGYVQKGKEDHVCRLKKALYGLKQAPRAWYEKIDRYFLDTGFVRSSTNSNLYMKVRNSMFVTFVVLYVDDLLITRNNVSMISDLKKDLQMNFEMTDLGLLHYFLGIEVWQTPGRVFISQAKYIWKVLRRFRMEDCKPACTLMETRSKLSVQDEGVKIDGTLYRQLVGSLIYLTTTRPDIAFAIGIVSRFMAEPKQSHWLAVKQILRYLRGTLQYGLEFVQNDDFKLQVHTDSDWAGCADTRRSTSGYSFSLGLAAVTWSSEKQPIVALSSTEAEYKAAAVVASEAIWLKQVLDDMGLDQEDATKLYCDNQSTIKLAKNPVFHARTKHIEVHHHFIRELIQNGDIELL
eukprot:Gb_07759 [translate_table: standard]